jgi:hypothetical protein
MAQFERYWLFTTFVLMVAVFLVRLVLRERVTLQSSLTFLAFLFGMVGLSLFPNATLAIGSRLGFALGSNFLFAVGLGALTLLHVSTLITLSRVELRSVTMVQELALMQEKLDRVAAAQQTGARPRTELGKQA